MEREDNSAIISKWMGLTAGQGLKAYDSVKDTYSRTGVPTDEQSKAYIAMLTATAGVSVDLAAPTIFAFSLASAAAKELATKK
jgi:hypothetical protein